MAPQRKLRRVLYEVYRAPKPPDTTRRKPTQPPPPREHRSPEPTTEAKVGGDIIGPSPNPVARPTSTPTPPSRWEAKINAPILAVAIAALIVLIAITLEAGRRLGTPATPTDDAIVTNDQDRSETVEGTPSEEPLLAQIDSPPAESGNEQASPSESAAGAPTESPAPAKPRARVALQRGYTYVVVQHFRTRDRQAAYDAARYLESHGIACATLTDKDVQVLATEPFLTTQDDSSAARAEVRRAEELQKRIRDLGAEYLKQGGGYSFKSCYRRTIK